MNQPEWQILLVEDEYDSTQMVSEILNFHGIEVKVARNGVECMEVLNALTPTLIIMDLAMPEMDGWETLTEIRNNPRTTHIPVVATTAYHSPNVEDNTQKAGFDGYFPKPVNPMSFVADLRRIVDFS
jgi:two-component system, cell cycle response regulator DivK